ncbi:MAG: iron-sulfur cluster assembly protein [Candidatus Caldatribacteriota bacterium]|nr:iron-sulfur cluster assembly protein [Candidatus Caldatribacteriota bacterium]
MTKDILEEDVRKVLEKIEHPAINSTLIDLGIIKEISIKENKVTIIIAFPFPNIPIGDYFVNSVREAIENLSAKPEIKITIMNQEEQKNFLAMEQENWKENT